MAASTPAQSWTKQPDAAHYRTCGDIISTVTVNALFDTTKYINQA
jgi:hypothetical protein